LGIRNYLAVNKKKPPKEPKEPEIKAADENTGETETIRSEPLNESENK
jgi:hypothetical protein